MVFEEGLSIGIYSPKIFGPRAMLVAALRARRTQNEGIVTLEFDDKEKIHPITREIVVVEIHKPMYLTHQGVVSISSVFQEVRDSLKKEEIRVDEAASRLQSAVQNKIVNDLDVPTELSEFEADFLLAAPMKNPDLIIDRTCSDPETATVPVTGRVLSNSQPFSDTLSLPAIRFMVAGLNPSKGKVKPGFMDVSVPGKLKRISAGPCEYGSWQMLHTDLYNDVSFSRFKQHLDTISPQVPLDLEGATRLVSDFILTDIRETLKLGPDYPVPVQIKMLNL